MKNKNAKVTKINTKIWIANDVSYDVVLTCHLKVNFKVHYLGYSIPNIMSHHLVSNLIPLALLLQPKRKICCIV